MLFAMPAEDNGMECDGMKRIMLVVAYEGTAYQGWQVQKNACTIEQILNETLSELLGEPITVTGASRTDSGVHSLGNVAVFDTDTRIPAEKLSYALNQRLPADIVIQSSREVASSFHPRKCKSRKTYEYRILNRTFPIPTLRRDTFFYHYPLDAERMNKAASYLIGRHDFKSFCSIHTQATDTVRELYACSVTRRDDLIILRIEGEGFLYNMVRIIAGTLIEVGCGKREPEEVKEILASCDRGAAGPTAPACGLTMMGICFEEEP